MEILLLENNEARFEKHRYLGALRTIGCVAGSVVERYLEIGRSGAVENLHVVHQVLVARLYRGSELKHVVSDKFSW